MKLQRMYASLKSDIQVIEKELENAIETNSPVLKEAYLNLLRAGGKRIRPVFVLLAAKFGNYDIHNIKDVAVSLELIHMASLVHDDVIDDAKLRRGKKTVREEWDNRTAMYTGDFILATSLEYITKITNVTAHEQLSKTMVEVCLGEIEQIRDKYVFDQHIKNYFRRIKRKTALLIASSCQLGAIAAGANETIHRKLFQFGYYVGMSYQIIDDILDFTSTEKQLGKPAGDDLLQGNITLPIILSLKDKQLKEKIEQVTSETSKSDMQEIIHAIKKNGSIEQSYQISQRYLQKALDTLDSLPDYSAKKTLQQIANYIGKRKY